MNVSTRLRQIEKAVREIEPEPCGYCGGFLMVIIDDGALPEEGESSALKLSLMRRGGAAKREDVGRDADGWYCRHCGRRAICITFQGVPRDGVTLAGEPDAAEVALTPPERQAHVQVSEEAPQ